MRKFRILRGVHSEGGCTYLPPAVFESEADLLRHNSTPDDPRFEQVYEETRAAAMAGCPELQPKTVAAVEQPAAKDAFDGKTVEELRGLAEEMEIDLGKARTRDQILAVLRSA
jgi:hypothetical protein